MKPEYKGEAFCTDDIIAMLRNQGLVIDDEVRARRVLSNVSYTRLKNYLVALMSDRKTHRFRPGTTFEEAYALYGFDRRLRELIFHEMEKIEISIRTQMAYASNCSEKGYWFLNGDHFKSEKAHEKLLKHLRYELQRTHNEGIINFRNKYSNEFPPSWLMLEAASMGTLVIMYECLSDESMREKVASHYKMTPDIFLSWTTHLLSVRNDCAHHNRVWNKAPSVKACLPDAQVMSTFNAESRGAGFPSMKEEDRHHIYMTLCIIKYFQDTIKPLNTFGARLKMLVGNFKMVDPALMGFPTGWADSDFWK